ncbi:MAG: aminotransferase class III-fold pyridoxal phosphate-dependent enzyme [Bacillota bacterium]
MEARSKIDAEDLLRDLEEYVNPGRARVYRLMGMTNVECSAEGSIVVDTEGNEFIDLCAGYAVINAGHRHPRIVAAVTEQLQHMGMSTKTMLSAREVELARALAEITPGDLKRSFLCATGTEAVEVALKVARMHTGRTGFVACENAFHGKTLGALSATGSGSYRDPFEPLIPGFTHVPYNDLEAMEEAVDDETAAVIVEPVQGEAGAVVPDPGYLPGVRRICDRAGALLIFDEVQSGMGRTGKNFGCEHSGVSPDIMTLAKGLGGGLMPVGAAVAAPEVFAAFDANPWIHSSTTGGNPLACAAAVAALEVLQEENLAGQAARKGEWVMGHLQELAARYPELIESVSGAGLLLGIRFTKPAGGIMVLTELFSRGVLVVPSLMNWKVMRIAPPLNIPEELLERGLEVLDETLEYVRPDMEQM